MITMLPLLACLVAMMALALLLTCCNGTATTTTRVQHTTASRFRYANANAILGERTVAAAAETKKAIRVTYVETGFIEQHLDHFRLNDPRTFQQRYFSSDRYVRHRQEQQQQDPTSTSTSSNTRMTVYAFLCVGGEGPVISIVSGAK
jgi:hypothetical protein